MLVYTPRDLGAAIRERRKTLGLDQITLAAKVGVSRRWLIQVEAGTRGASFGLLLRTMHALGMQMHLTAEGESQEVIHQPMGTPDLDAVLGRARRNAPSK
jgi:HTH-type transcriptional regulator/antitoxin HipB